MCFGIKKKTYEKIETNQNNNKTDIKNKIIYRVTKYYPYDSSYYKIEDYENIHDLSKKLNISTFIIEDMCNTDNVRFRNIKIEKVVL